MQKIFTLGAILVTLLLGLIYISHVERDLLRIQQTGERAIIEPIVDFKKAEMSLGEIGEDGYIATFKYKTLDGRKIIQERSFSSELLDDIQKNKPIIICYTPNDPENFIFEKSTPSVFLFLFIMLLFHIVAVAFKNALAELRIQRHDEEVRIITAHLEGK